MEGTLSTYDVVIKPLAAVRTAATHAIVPNYDQLGPVFKRLFGQGLGYVTQHTRPSGLCFAWYHDANEEAQFEVEAVIPIAELIPATDTVRVRDLPAVAQAACLVHQGAFDTIGHAYQHLMTWVQQNGYRVIGDTREVYVQMDAKGDPKSHVTEIQIPVERLKE